MTFEKIPKTEWDKMTMSEQSYFKLQFDKSVEHRIKVTVIATRIIALMLIGVLFFIGFAQFKAADSYGQIKDQYGNDAYCYLCGLESYKKCDCQYFSEINDVILEDLENYSESLAEYNIRKCAGMKVQDGSYQYGAWYSDINVTLVEDGNILD
jgi:hypothetical protein